MAYEKNTWIDNETPITAEKLNKMEQGIEDAGKTGGVEVGTIVYIEDDAEVPEGWNVVEGDNALPIGSGMDYYGATAPKGYMFADGSAISRTEYAELFKIFGTTYGAGDGSTTFNLPDKRSRVSVTKDSGTFNTLGKKGGEETHTLTVNEMPRHLHNSYVTGYSGWGSMELYGYVHKLANLSNQAGGYATVENTNVAPMVTQEGGSVAHNILQPYLVCNYIIKVKSLKAIMKVSVTELEAITGSIVDGTNIDDKVHNTYSANTIDGLVAPKVNANYNDLRTSSVTVAQGSSEHIYSKEIETTGRPLVVFASLTAKTTGGNWALFMYLDGNSKSRILCHNNQSSQNFSNMQILRDIPAGTHTIDFFVTADKETTIYNYNQETIAFYEI